MDNSNNIGIKVTDPLCPRIDLTMRTKISRSQARARFSAKGREKIANALSLLLPLDDKSALIIDELAAWVLRLEYATATKVVDKNTKKTKRVSIDQSIPVLQRDSTRAIADEAKRLLKLLKDVDDPVRRRIRTQMGDAEKTTKEERKASGTRRYHAMRLGLKHLITGAEHAERRIRIKNGRQDGVALTTLVHQLARIWVIQRGEEPTWSKKARPGTFNKFVEVVFQAATLKDEDQIRLVRKVVEHRDMKIATERTHEDEESEANYTEDSEPEESEPN